MRKIEVLTTRHTAAWMTVLEQSAQYDFYHLPQYHALAESGGEGTAHLFRYTEDAYSIALPLLLRPVDGLPGIQSGGTGWCDATSVYGYPGPICSHVEIPDAVVGRFQAALCEQLHALRVVSVFSRLHPIIPQQRWIAGLGECKTLAPTVSIDLTAPAEVQRSAYRKNHREGISKLLRKGVTCIHDANRVYLNDFIRIYHETMRRVAAAESYFFTPAYFRQLSDALGPRLNLFVCLQDGRAICSGLFVECNGIIQYHLGGTSNDALKLAPMKLMVEAVRAWGTQKGHRDFHMGGGATPRPDDPLLHFKLGFSDRTHDFCVWRWILYPDVYQRLTEQKMRSNERVGAQSAIHDYFPAYRGPTVAKTLRATVSMSSEALPESVSLSPGAST